MSINAAVLKELGASRPYSESGPVQIEKVELASPQGEEVRVKVEVASLCHSDLSLVNGARVRPLPMVIGHEASGTVVEVGDEVTRVNVGDRVCFTFQPHCDECDLCKTTGGKQCRTAFEANQNGTLLHGKQYLSQDGKKLHHHTGVSAFAEETVVHQSSIIPVEDDLPFEIASLIACAVTTGGGAVKNAGKLQKGERVAVVGGGGVGMAAVLVAKAFEAELVDIVDPAEAKHKLFQELGADHSYTPESAPADYYDLVIEAAGVGPALESAVNMLRGGGRVVAVGMPTAETQISINPLDLVFKSKSVIGSYQGSGRIDEDIDVYTRLWREGRLPLEKLISRELPLTQINSALDEMSDAVGLRQVIRIR